MRKFVKCGNIWINLDNVETVIELSGGTATVYFTGGNNVDESYTDLDADQTQQLVNAIVA